jgi:hypothetical protein
MTDPYIDDAFWPLLAASEPVMHWKAEDILAVMASESGLNPRAYNKGGGAAGLNQMMPATLKGLHYSDPRPFQELAASEQLPWVLAFFKPYVGKLTSAARIYAFDFLPATAIGNDWSLQKTICGQNGPYTWAYKDNPAFDATKKGYITGLDMAVAATRGQNRLGHRWEDCVALLNAARQSRSTDAPPGPRDSEPPPPSAA